MQHENTQYCSLSESKSDFTFTVPDQLPKFYNNTNYLENFFEFFFVLSQVAFI